ncbi:MAG: hypothetical protein ABEJ58_09835 [Halodesulfurarchaeum sp.]
MSCELCGAPKTRRFCRVCESLDRLEDRLEENREHPECPECGGSTSGAGVRCYRCRGGSSP